MPWYAIHLLINPESCHGKFDNKGVQERRMFSVAAFVSDSHSESVVINATPSAAVGAGGECVFSIRPFSWNKALGLHLLPPANQCHPGYKWWRTFAQFPGCRYPHLRICDMTMEFLEQSHGVRSCSNKGYAARRKMTPVVIFYGITLLFLWQQANIFGAHHHFFTRKKIENLVNRNHLVLQKELAKEIWCSFLNRIDRVRTRSDSTCICLQVIRHSKGSLMSLFGKLENMATSFLGQKRSCPQTYSWLDKMPNKANWS